MYFFKDGDVYDGEWKNGDMHGKGIYYYISGEIYEGEWKNGKMVKWKEKEFFII